jgi:integrase
MSSINKGLSANFDKAVFRHMFKTWFYEVLKPTLALSSLNRYESDYKLRIRDCVLSDMKLTEIKPINVQGYYNSLLEQYSINTARNTHKLLKNFFGYCVKADLIIKSPLAAVELPTVKPSVDEFKVLSHQDIKKLLEASKLDDGIFIYLFAVLTGLRQGELLALTYNDIDFTAGTVKVNKSVSYMNADGEYKAVLAATKTPSSIRDVPILPELKGPLQRHVRHETGKKIISIGSERLLFPSVSGTYREASNVRKTWTRVQNRLGIDKISFHALRHTFCTLLAQMDVPLKTASVLMGHSDIAITARIYTHVDKQELRRGIDKLSALFN